MKTTALALSAFVTLFAASADAAEPHDHHSAGDKPKVEVQKGEKFESDAPLRSGMLEIKQAVQASLPALHEGKLSAADAADLGKKVDVQVKGIFANCKLAPTADQVLHDEVILPIMDASKTLQSADGDHKAGVVKMVKALDAYGNRFNHSGWAPVKH